MLQNAIAAFARLRVAAFADVGEDVVIRGRVWIRGRGKVIIGNRARLDGSIVPIELHAIAKDAELVIGDDVEIEGGASIEAERKIVIGARARIGAYCKVMDSHFHTLGDYGTRPKAVPLVIGEDVVIGAKAVLLPGARVDARCVIRPGTVVTRAVGEGTVLEGCPARAVANGRGR